MMKYARLLFFSFAVAALTVPMAGCGGGPEYSKEGEGKTMVDPAKMTEAAGGAPENIKP